MNTLIETLQKRIAELERENVELWRDCKRYENAHFILMAERSRHLTELKALRCSRIPHFS